MLAFKPAPTILDGLCVNSRIVRVHEIQTVVDREVLVSLRQEVDATVRSPEVGNDSSSGEYVLLYDRQKSSCISSINWDEEAL